MAFAVIYSTASSAQEAERLAEGLVSGRLAACVQQMPIKSIYRWKGAVEKADEVLLIVKTRKTLVNKVIGWIKENHSYEVPEAIAVDISGGLDAYLKWVGEETGA